ncbi:hypothetical protein TNIN_340451 [Trichonephila inaurata madagascariensis]|uniref:Uncharacterized protein n=1 Tax=Trichonephila inaurata madagascariensis TaxID=2747483 RepID=A0A8X6YVN1_9ARAC|nr:hypothetical protein TNIN_340451 [Trichonephila inaurata madagascariensis]
MMLQYLLIGSKTHLLKVEIVVLKVPKTLSRKYEFLMPKIPALVKEVAQKAQRPSLNMNEVIERKGQIRQIIRGEKIKNQYLDHGKEEDKALELSRNKEKIDFCLTNLAENKLSLLCTEPPLSEFFEESLTVKLEISKIEHHFLLTDSHAEVHYHNVRLDTHQIMNVLLETYRFPNNER